MPTAEHPPADEPGEHQQQQLGRDASHERQHERLEHQAEAEEEQKSVAVEHKRQSNGGGHHATLADQHGQFALDEPTIRHQARVVGNCEREQPAVQPGGHPAASHARCRESAAGTAEQSAEQPERTARPAGAGTQSEQPEQPPEQSQSADASPSPSDDQCRSAVSRAAPVDAPLTPEPSRPAVAGAEHRELEPVSSSCGQSAEPQRRSGRSSSHARTASAERSRGHSAVQSVATAGELLHIAEQPYRFGLAVQRRELNG